MIKWMPIPRYEGLYEVSCDGRVRSMDIMKNHNGRKQYLYKGRVKKCTKAKNGYYVVSLHNKGVKKVRHVHDLVLEAFVGERPNGYDASHIDGDKLNNHKDNLNWESRADNVRRKKEHGTQLFGEKCSWSKLNWSKVEDIRYKYKNKIMTQPQLAKEYKVCQQSISDIILYKIWNNK